MTADSEISGNHLEYLTGQVASLRTSLEEITRRLEMLEREKVAGGKNKAHCQASVIMPPSGGREVVMAKAGTGVFLPRLAAVCFVLVFALILRTVTDSNLVDARVGSLLGLGYAAALILWGWRFYCKGHSLAPVFPISGLLLLFTIVLEAHGRFGSLSSFAAYVVLFGAGFVVTLLGLRARAAVTLGLGAVLTSILAISIDFPYPFYPLLAIFPLAGSVAAYFANKRRLCPSLRWTTLGVAVFFWMFWSFKLSAQITCGATGLEKLHVSWFLPYLFLFWVFYWFVGVQTIYRTASKGESVGFYDGMLPTISSFGVFFAAWTMMNTWHCGDIVWLGVGAFLLGVVNWGTAAWLAGHKREGAPGVNIYGLAGAVLVASGMAITFAEPAWAFLLWSLIAFELVYFAGRWGNGGLRFTSYLLQLSACIALVASGVSSINFKAPVTSGVVFGGIAVISIVHYMWCRSHKPPTINSAYFSWLDRKDYSAVVLLLAGLASGFFLLRLGLHEVLVSVVDDFADMFCAGQTVFINFGAMLLLLIAGRRRNVEIMIVAVAVGLLGMIKAFIFDMFAIKGVSLVMSVFSFGMVAAVGSLVSSRWQQGGKPEETGAAIS